jgi:CopG antitoxin of type II toxin-antitoxin system
MERGDDMKKNRSSISKAQSYAKIGEFWDKHDLTEYWDRTKKVKFDVVLEPEATYYPVPKDLAEEINSVARNEGVTSRTLVNRWLGQKLKERQRRTGKVMSKNP